MPREAAALRRAAWKLVLTAIEARRPAAAREVRRRWTRVSGGPKRRSVPAMSRTQEAAFGRERNSMRGENWAAHSSRTARAAASVSVERWRRRRLTMASASRRDMPSDAPSRWAWWLSEQRSLHGRTAVENSDGQGFKLGAQAKQALGGEFGGVDACVEMGFHADSFFETLAHEA